MKNNTSSVITVIMTVLIAAFCVAALSCTSLTAYAAVSVRTEAALRNAVNDAVGKSGGGEIKLTQNVAIADCLRILAGQPVTLDLNGKMIDRGLTVCQDIGSVIRVEPGATLTIKDSSNDNSGVITGGASWNGGGIYNHGTLTITGGTIRNNKAQHSQYGDGGGIYNGSYDNSRATLTLTGGAIINNATRNGAGIYNSDGTVLIKKGTYSVTVLSKADQIRHKRKDQRQRGVGKRQRYLEFPSAGHTGFSGDRR